MHVKQKIHLSIYIFLAIFIISAVEVKGQFESSKWVFGYGAGVDFISGQPISFSGSKLKTSEGCSSVSDSKGNLLFYTNGVTVWNKNNGIMPNGNKLNGHLSSTQSAIIVPKPGSKNLYYIFTMDSEAEDGGCCYSIVDLSKEQGLGDITIKNQLVKIHCTEKITAVKQPNSNDIWIIIHVYNSNTFLTYLLTKDGLSTKPVISQVGISHDKSIYNTIGYMKISPDKKKLAVAINGDKSIQIFDFDIKRGIVSNPLTVTFASNESPYGLEFSPSNSLLYVGIETLGLVYQINLAVKTEDAMQKSICLIGQSKSKKKLGALQLGIDGKIYVAEYQSKFLSTINNPNVLGTNCSFRSNAIFLNDNVCMFGLPTFYQEYVKPVIFEQKSGLFNMESKIELNKKYVLNNIFFDFNQAILRNSSIDELKKLIDYLKVNTKLKIVITGHTDSIGTVKYNTKLSLSRAKEIGTYLINNGIESTRISFAGKGSSEPVSSNSNEEGRQKNRRVEFMLKEQ